jgi:hypothetical protein
MTAHDFEGGAARSRPSDPDDLTAATGFTTAAARSCANLLDHLDGYGATHTHDDATPPDD